MFYYSNIILYILYDLMSKRNLVELTLDEMIDSNGYIFGTLQYSSEINRSYKWNTSGTLVHSRSGVPTPA